MSVVIQKTKISVDTSDLGEAQVELLKTGNAAIKFGKKTKAASKSVGGFGSKVGNLSESLDKKLEGSLGKVFKATDRLTSIVGQVTGALGLAGLVIGAVVGAAALLGEAFAEVEERTKSFGETFQEEVIDKFEKASVAAEALSNKVDDVFKDANLSKLTPDIQQQVILLQERVELLRASSREAREEGIQRTSLVNKGKLELEDLRKRQKLNSESIDALPNIIELEKERMNLAKNSITFAKEIKALQRSINHDNEVARKQLRNSNEDKQRQLDLEKQIDKIVNKVKKKVDKSKVTNKKKQDAEAAALIARTNRILDENFKLISDIEAILIKDSWKDWNGNLLDASISGTELEGNFRILKGAIKETRTELTIAQKEVIAFSNAASGQLAKSLEETGEAALNAGFDAAFYGSSFKDALNDFFEAQTKEAAVSTVMETAKGFAQTAIGNLPSAANHFGAAAAFAVVASASGLGAAATGGFNGPTEELDKENKEDFTGAAETTTESRRGPTETVVNLNFTASGPIPRIERQRMSQELLSLISGR